MTKQRYKKKNGWGNLKNIEWDIICGFCKLVQLLLFVTIDMMIGRHFFFDTKLWLWLTGYFSSFIANNDASLAF